MKQSQVKVGKVSDYLYALMTSTKAKKFRAGFMKKADDFKKSGKYVYRVGKFDLLNRSTWKQTDGTMYKRKGKTRTTKADEYILAHDLDKKAPRNISYARMKWLNVGKKFYKIKHLKTKVKVIEFPKVEFDVKKDLLDGNWDILERI